MKYRDILHIWPLLRMWGIRVDFWCILKEPHDVVWLWTSAPHSHVIWTTLCNHHHHHNRETVCPHRSKFNVCLAFPAALGLNIVSVRFKISWTPRPLRGWSALLDSKTCQQVSQQMVILTLQMMSMNGTHQTELTKADFQGHSLEKFLFAPILFSLLKCVQKTDS